MTQFTQEEIDASWKYFAQHWLFPRPFFFDPTALRLDSGEHQRARRKYLNAALTHLQSIYAQAQKDIFALITRRFLDEGCSIELLQEDDLARLVGSNVWELNPKYDVNIELFYGIVKHLLKSCTIAFDAIVAENDREAFERWLLLCRKLRKKYPDPSRTEVFNAWETEVVPGLMGNEACSNYTTRRVANFFKPAAITQLRQALEVVRDEAGQGFSPNDILTPGLIRHVERCHTDSLGFLVMRRGEALSIFNSES